MNTLVWGFESRKSKIIEGLESEGVISPKVWFLNKKPDKCAENQFSVLEFLGFETWAKTYADKINDVTEGILFNSEIYNNLYSHIYEYMEKESRCEIHGMKPFHHYLNKFNLLYKFLYALMVKNKIEVCLFHNLPHEGSDYIVYLIAKALNIKTILLFQSQTPCHYDKIYYMDSIEDYGNFSFMKKRYDENDYKIKVTTTDDLWYMKKKKKLSFREIREMLPFYKKNKYARFRKYKNTLNSLIEEVDYSKNYIYFPMQMQPELTTSTIGNLYCNQMLALERLSEKLPENWVIYAKENPKQREYYRDEMFFERLRLLKNVKLVPLDEISAKLIKYSKIVANITGTAGWEALCQEKPIITFGQTWYQNFEGSFIWNDDIDILSVANYKLDFAKLEQDYNDLLTRMPNAVIDFDYLGGIQNYDETKSMTNIKNLLKSLIVRETADIK